MAVTIKDHPCRRMVLFFFVRIVTDQAELCSALLRGIYFRECLIGFEKGTTMTKTKPKNGRESKILVGERLRICRERLGLTQKELADRSGVAPNHLCHLESGSHSPSIDTLGSLTCALHMSLGEFFADDGPVSTRYRPFIEMHEALQCILERNNPCDIIALQTVFQHMSPQRLKLNTPKEALPQEMAGV